MNQALDRWSRRDDRNLDDLLGFEDENGLAVGDTEPSGSQEKMTILGLTLPNFPDDLSTIAGDTVNMSIALPVDPHALPVYTPEKQKDRFQDEDTQPETPTRGISGSTESMTLTDRKIRRKSNCFHRLLGLAAICGTVLLGVIAVMALTLFQLRNEENMDSSNSAAEFSPSSFDFSPLFDTPSASPTTQPTIDWIYWIALTVLDAAPTAFYASPSEIFHDTTSTQYQVLEWISRDPAVESYSPQRVLQRFALGVLFQKLSVNSKSIASNWMSHTDECEWTTSRDNETMCDEMGHVNAIYLEDMGLNGTLATEIGLLSNLQMLFLTSNSIKGTLPTELGLLTKLERLHVPRNEIGGEIPSEIGLLQALGEYQVFEIGVWDFLSPLCA